MTQFTLIFVVGAATVVLTVGLLLVLGLYIIHRDLQRQLEGLDNGIADTADAVEPAANADFDVARGDDGSFRAVRKPFSGSAPFEANLGDFDPPKSASRNAQDAPRGPKTGRCGFCARVRAALGLNAS